MASTSSASQQGSAEAAAVNAETPQDPTGLEAIEAELTRDVEWLLEAMNKSSSEVNWLESEAASAQQKYQHSLADWTSLSEDMRTRHGQTFDAVRPYFDAVHRVRGASQRAQAVTRSFAAAANQCKQATADLRKIEEGLAYGAHSVSLDCDQQEGLSRATVHALKSQQERDKCEREYIAILHEYEEAKKAAERSYSEVGKQQIQRMKPCFRQLQQNQLHVDERRKHFSALQERVRVAKHTYNQSMNSLERISTAVHHARKEHKEKEAAKKELLGERTESPEQDHPAAETGENFAFGDPLKKRSDTGEAFADDAPLAGVELGQLSPEVTCADAVVDDSPFA